MNQMCFGNFCVAHTRTGTALHKAGAPAVASLSRAHTLYYCQNTYSLTFANLDSLAFMPQNWGSELNPATCHSGQNDQQKADTLP